ncbi:hypothetical protein, partial [Klebsiella pneumoniae]|uniref:hypothetical protein n=1 Tax=Klebsiella pneumoniae TaxID=573 RepID=UPI00385347EB
KLLLDSFTWLKQKIILNRSHFAYLQDHEYQIIKNGLLSRNREVLDSLLRQLDYGLTSSHVLNVSLRDQNPIVDDGKPWAYIGGAWG